MKRTILLSVAGLVLLFQPLHALTPDDSSLPSFSVSIDSRAWATLNMSLESPLLDEKLRAAVSVSVPILMYAQGSGLDTFQASVGFSSNWQMVQTIPLYLHLRIQLRGISQNQVLGEFFGMGTNLEMYPFWSFKSVTLGPIISWNKVWLTRIRLSQESIQAFEDSSQDFLPADGWYAWGVSELHIGARIKVFFSKTGLGFLGLGQRVSLGSMAGFLEGFSLGEWPFWLELGWEQRF